MPSALYYPHLRLDNEDLLRASLLLWDRVDVLVPDTGMSLTMGYSGAQAEARELLLTTRVPSADEKQGVERRLAPFVESGAREWVRRRLPSYEDLSVSNSPSGPDEYRILAEKLSLSTWERLSELGLAWRGDDQAVAVPPALGFVLMAMLADECAGELLHKVTDREDAYGDLFGVMTQELGGAWRSSRQSSLTRAVNHLVAIAVPTIDASSIPLERLVALRQREATDSGITTLRHQYVRHLMSYAPRLLAPSLTANDRKELDAEFRSGAEHDLACLKEELRMARTDALLSREVVTTAVAVGGAFATGFAAAPIAVVGGVVGIGALIATGVKYARAREKALSAHPTSWLFVNRPRLWEQVQVRVR